MHLPTHKLQLRQKSTIASPEAITHVSRPHPVKSHPLFNIKDKCNVQVGVTVLHNVSKWTDKAALMLQKHGDQGVPKNSVERHVRSTSMPRENGGHDTKVMRETVVHEKTQAIEKPDVTRGVEVRNDYLLKETIVYKEPESKEKPQAIKEVKVYKKVEVISAPGNTTGAGNATDSLEYNTIVPMTGIILLTEAHELHSYDSEEEEGKHTEHSLHDTDSEHEDSETSDEEDEDSETSDEEDEHKDEHEDNGYEKIMDDTNVSDEEIELIRVK